MSTSTLTRSRMDYDLDIETIPLPSRRPDRGSGRVTIVSSFAVAPGQEQKWLDTWEALKSIALEHHACHGFRMYRDLRDDGHFIILSEWTDRASFHRFARAVSLTWLERVMPGLCLPIESTSLERIDEPVSLWEKIGT